ncbi:MAG: hypothetical protein HFJ50_07455 [Clostridia bacterium]|nr:hypothetical protein [Clostridia bacterium]
MKKIILFLLSLIAVSFLIIAIKEFCFNIKTKMLMESLEGMTKCLEENQRNDEEKTPKFQDDVIGMIIIPKIEIEAPIKEGTSTQILKYTVRTL